MRRGRRRALGGEEFDVTDHQVLWNTAWRNLRKAAGLSNLRFHDHTFVTMTGERRVPLQILGAMVGHMSPQMVKYYTNTSGTAAREAVVMLDKMRNPSQFVDVLVDESLNAKTEAANLLN
jgi:hypothetical protein